MLSERESGCLVCARDRLQIFAVTALRALLGYPLERRKRDVTLSQGDLFRAGDPQALALLQDLDEMAGFDQRGMRPGIEPGKAAAEHLDMQVAAFEIGLVESVISISPRADGLIRAAISTTSLS